jgi:hypothetical protein
MSAPLFNQISDTLRDLITPLQPGQVAIYQLLTKENYAVQEMPDGRTVNTLIAPPTAILAAQATIYDPYKGRGERVELMAIAGSVRTKDGLEPTEDEIIFKGGRFPVRHDQPDLYTFMELHPGNKDCVVPGNNPIKGYQFERVLEAKAAKDKALGFEQSIKAQTELNTYSEDELRRVARRLKMDATADRDSLFVALIQRAQTEGEQVYEAIGDRAVKLESMVASALSEGVLEWEGDSRRYVLKDSRQTFLPIPHGDNPQEELVAEMMNPRLQKQRTMLEKLVDAKQKASKKNGR